ncbi:MAG: deoxyribodipyrimidine photo-lyase [Roseovarius sp.]|nr:deoxyribodipyrimidine photo-lyase [Roseovarius sp.]
MFENAPVILWCRRDLRLHDHPAMLAATGFGGPLIPVFIRDGSVDNLGAAAKWRLGLAIDAFSKTLAANRSRLILRSGPALETLACLIRETGARAVMWSRLYDPQSIARDRKIKSALREAGVFAESHHGHLLFEPWQIKTRQGGHYRVFTPMWREIEKREVPEPKTPPVNLKAPNTWPESETLSDWQMGRSMNRGAAVCLPWQNAGEEAALRQLERFSRSLIANYGAARDFAAKNGTSNLSENLTYGEISPRQCWKAGLGAARKSRKGAHAWLRQLAWREFAYHLMYHTPHILVKNWREEWGRFPWKTNSECGEAVVWKRGCTGVPFVDAAMREMYVTGRMHNRGRMIAASYLVKHLLVHWKVGMDWFADCLTDWDPACNAMGWQWVAGSGPDSSPYFRIFNPDTQSVKFDPRQEYICKWIAEMSVSPSSEALGYFDAVPLHWGLAPDMPYSNPILSLKSGRERALAAYRRFRQ